MLWWGIWRLNLMEIRASLDTAILNLAANVAKSVAEAVEV